MKIADEAWAEALRLLRETGETRAFWRLFKIARTLRCAVPPDVLAEADRIFDPPDFCLVPRLVTEPISRPKEGELRNFGFVVSTMWRLKDRGVTVEEAAQRAAEECGVSETTALHYWADARKSGLVTDDDLPKRRRRK